MLVHYDKYARSKDVALGMAHVQGTGKVKIQSDVLRRAGFLELYDVFCERVPPRLVLLPVPADMSNGQMRTFYVLGRPSKAERGRKPGGESAEQIYLTLASPLGHIGYPPKKLKLMKSEERRVAANLKRSSKGCPVVESLPETWGNLAGQPYCGDYVELDLGGWPYQLEFPGQGQHGKATNSP